MKLTKQGVRDLNTKGRNGRKEMLTDMPKQDWLEESPWFDILIFLFCLLGILGHHWARPRDD